MLGFDLRYVAVAAAACLALWPQIAWVIKRVKMPSFPSAPTGVSYQEAMVSLADVRRRLEQTGGVPDDAGKAIEVITHALVEGSAK